MRERHRVCVGFALLLLAAGGCRPFNRPLNSLKMPLESRVRNSTRALLGAELTPLDALETQHIRPATRPGEAANNVADVARCPTDDDGYFVGLAISGGGSRSANFGAASMFQLQRLGMLQRVDYLSCVSGGSIAGAYYCTQGDAWNVEAVQKKLTHGFANDVLFQTILPWNMLALMFTSVDRSDLLADSFQRTVFNKNGRPLTYADLRDDRPRLLINATDLQTGKRFVFSNESFDEINSDLSTFPIARAVAASSAVPVLLHQVTIKDYSTTFNQYRHLIDGGVSDNLGAATLVETFSAHVEQARAAGLPDPYPHGAVLLFIDATVAYDARLSDKSDISFLDSIVFGMGASTTSLLNRAGSATLAEIIVRNAPDDAPARDLRRYIRELKETGHLTLKDRTGHTVRVVHVALGRVGDLRDLPFMSFSERVNNIATYFNIDRTEAFHLYQAAQMLIEQQHEPMLRAIMDEMNGGPSGAGGPATRQNQGISESR
jgi:predicted acylesterase/phospholipase RssA